MYTDMPCSMLCESTCHIQYIVSCHSKCVTGCPYRPLGEYCCNGLPTQDKLTPCCMPSGITNRRSKLGYLVLCQPYIRTVCFAFTIHWSHMYKTTCRVKTNFHLVNHLGLGCRGGKVTSITYICDIVGGIVIFII